MNGGKVEVRKIRNTNSILFWMHVVLNLRFLGTWAKALYNGLMWNNVVVLWRLVIFHVLHDIVHCKDNQYEVVCGPCSAAFGSRVVELNLKANENTMQLHSYAFLFTLAFTRASNFSTQILDDST